MNAIPKPRQLQPQISAQERARRQASIDNARGSVRFEGFVLPSEVEQINRRFIEGELTGDQHMEAIKAAVLHG
ncbi:MAG: antitoxin VbhA family protein [Acidovorax sp.]|uniref:antitoxin VbhA family protein n=1 Tax=Acidovorax sp. TaxID=1872122 RepID=UPI0039E39514